MFVHDLIICIYLFIVITTRSMSHFTPFFNFPNLFYRIFYHLLVTFFIFFYNAETDIRCRFYYDCPRLEYHFCECIEDFCAYIRLN
ncbi:Nodule Cysteine-Rich (NCR) secreted peptide [Medicago truncatula]|uniref:Nodule Cysteine-Rich (NCR) secreted peptide n=1 Tax=Medicago truncatula TaxID=3880 RepID=A0A072UJY0_MEDTR|nr:Nodule Cysteine-Rich (NCR) secreted peptide [Medicago truncatula]